MNVLYRIADVRGRDIAIDPSNDENHLSQPAGERVAINCNKNVRDGHLQSRLSTDRLDNVD